MRKALSQGKAIKSLIHRNPKIWVFVAVFAIIGTAMLIISKAATPTLSFEAEDGTITGSASVIPTTGTDSTLSGGKAIMFASASNPSGSDFHTCYPDAFCTPSNQVVVMNGANIRYVGENTNVTSLAQMQKLKTTGFNSVRLVMDWEAFQPSSGTGGFSTTVFNNLKSAVDNATSAGIYVILDPIHFGGTGTSCGSSALCIPSWARVSSSGTYQGAAKSVQANARDYIEKVAGDYANNPTVVAIDLVNEPKPDPFNGDDNLLMSMYSTLIGWARGKDPDKILIVEPDSGGGLAPLAALKTLSRKDNIVFSFHHYYGGAHNSNGTLISGCNPSGYNNSGGDCGNHTYENNAGYPVIIPSDLRAQFQANLDVLADPALKLPLWVGEWGIIEGGANSVQWRKDMTAIFKDLKTGRAYWQFANSTNDPPTQNMSMTVEGSSTPGAFKSWINDIL